MADPRRVHRHRRRAVGTGIVVVVGLAVGVTVWQSGASGATGYRTATASSQTVTQTMAVSGDVTPVHQATADFQVEGTVSKLDVAAGQHVTAGQKLASLDTTALQQAVTSAKTSVAAAQAQLTENEADESSGLSSGDTGNGSTASDTASSTAPAHGSTIQTDADVISTGARTTAASPTGHSHKPPSGSKGTGGSSGATSLKGAQQAVVDAQKTADAASQTAAADLHEAQTACAASSTTPPTSSTTSSRSTTDPSTTAASSTTSSTIALPASSTTSSTTSTTDPSTTAAITSSSSACAQALQNALGAQQHLSTDQTAVSQAENTLAKLLSSASTTKTGSGTTPSGSGKTSKGGTGKGGTGKSGTGKSGTGKSGTGKSGTGKSGTGYSTGKGTTGSSGTHTGNSDNGTGSKSSGSGNTSSESAAADSAQQLASDQAQIDTADAQLIEAEQSLADAQLTSPLTGTVASVSLASGQTVSANDTSDGITILNSSGYEATASLTSTQVSSIKMGDKVELTVDGVSGSLTGTVTVIGPVEVSDSTYTYPLVVAISGTTGSIPAGSTANVQVVLSQVNYALSVPTSAVHTAATGDSYVDVLKNGKETEQKVTVGVVGDTYTQIRSGLAKGDQVVLADLGEAIPSSGTSTDTGGFAGAGGARAEGGKFAATSAVAPV